jgi:hypothetical protein
MTQVTKFILFLNNIYNNMKQTYIRIILAICVFVVGLLINIYMKPVEGFAFLKPSTSFVTFKPVIQSTKHHIRKYRRGLRNFIHGVAKKI